MRGFVKEKNRSGEGNGKKRKKKKGGKSRYIRT